MNNLKPFNLSSFNISGGQQEEDIDFSMFCYERYDTTITFSKNTPLLIVCSERVQTKNQLTMTIPNELNLQATLNAEAKGNIVVVVELEGREEIQAKAFIAENISDSFDLEAAFNLSSYLACDKEVEFSFEEDLNFKEISLALDILSSGFSIHESLISNLQSTILSNLVTKLQENCRPGDRIVIDSDVFTAYKNNENILDKYSGEWIYLSRDLESIEINGNGKFKAKLIFRERFL